MLKRVPNAVAAVFLGGMQVAALAQDKEANLGLLMWSAFKCATYAELFGNKDEQARLFNVGYDAGKSFLKGIENQTVTEAELRSKTPVIVRLLLAGPSADFIIGRVFESATGDAYDAVVSRDTNGVPLDPSKWVMDDELRALIARTKYHRSSCELIQ